MYFRRSIHPLIKSHLDRKEFTILTGPRQSGKTTILDALSGELREEGKNVHYVTFEDRDILAAVNAHPEELFTYVPRPEKIAGTGETTEKRLYLFIDEVQYASQPSNFLKYLFDLYHDNLKVTATGSSAFYLDHKFTDSLAGRKRIFELKTLSFEEFLVFRNKEQLRDELLHVRDRKEYISSFHRELTDLFDEYLVFGGYPEIVLENVREEKILLLKELRNSFLKKDMDESGVDYPDKFYNLMNILAGQTGNLVNKNELSNTVGLDNKTIDKYLYILQKCFHIALLKPFYSNQRKELTKMPKIYFKDAGMRNIVLNRLFDFRDREDQDALVVNHVFKRLTDLYDKDHIKFWRTTDNKEIDFVLTASHDEGLAYEVKLKCRKTKQTSSRKFREIYPNFPLEVVSYERDPGCTWILKL